MDQLLAKIKEVGYNRFDLGLQQLIRFGAKIM